VSDRLPARPARPLRQGADGPRPLGTARAALLVGLSCAWPVGARAYRPFDSTDAAVSRRGEMEIELGPVGYLRPGGANILVVPNLVLNWGFAENWEVVLEGRGLAPLAAASAAPAYAIDETDLFLKVVLRRGSLQDVEGPSVATEFGALLPTVNAQPGVGAEATLIVSEMWPALALHLNASVAWTRAHTLGGFAGLIVEGPDAWTLRPVGEVYFEAEHGGPSTISALAGAIWRTSEVLSFDAAVRAARTGAGQVYEVRLGFTWDGRVGSID